MSVDKENGMSDFIVTHHGTLALFEPQNDEAREHLEENVSDEAQWFGNALVVEPRYVLNLVAGLEEEGFSTEA